MDFQNLPFYKTLVLLNLVLPTATNKFGLKYAENCKFARDSHPLNRWRSLVYASNQLLWHLSIYTAMDYSQTSVFVSDIPPSLSSIPSPSYSDIVDTLCLVVHEKEFIEINIFMTVNQEHRKAPDKIDNKLCIIWM